MEDKRFIMNRKTFIFFGPPGSGKGTQANLLGNDLKIPTISLGKLLRQEKQGQTDLGKKIEEYLDNGRLVPDEIVGEVIRERLGMDDVKSGFILDGYPRTKSQLEYLKSILQDSNGIYFVFIDVGDEEIKKRLGGRRNCSCGATYHLVFNPPKEEGICDDCKKELRMRGDDKPEIIKHRLELYHEETAPVIQGLEGLGNIIHINGEKGIEEIQNEIKEQIK